MGYPIYHSAYTAAQIEAAIDKGPRINSAGYWEVWNVETMAYESTGVGAGVTPPTVVTQVSQMTNHGYVYIYNGNETGYTPGYWYYWNGTAWTAGGAYQVAATDPTLSVAGAAADAKACGELKSDLSLFTNPVYNHDNIVGDPTCLDTTVYSGTSTDNYKKWKFIGITPTSVKATEFSNAFKFTHDGTNKPYLLQDFWASDFSAGTYHIAFLIKASYTSSSPSFGGSVTFTGYPTVNNSGGTTLGQKSITSYSRFPVAGNEYYLFEDTVTISDPSSYHHVRCTIYFNQNTLDVWVAEPYLSKQDGAYTAIGKTLADIKKDVKSLQNVSVLYGKSLYIDGDSIAYGAGSDGVSYGDLLATKYSMTLNKQAVNGGTMGYVVDKHCIADSVVSNFNSEDFVILDGGFNDLGSSVPIGAFPTSVEQPLTPSPTTDTFIGAMEVAFQHIMNTSPTTKIYFLIPHRIYKSYTKPSGSLGLTFADYVDAIREVCNRYGVEILDVYDNVNFNTYLDVYKAYTLNSDTVHPTLTGYTDFYMPYIEKVTS